MGEAKFDTTLPWINLGDLHCLCGDITAWQAETHQPSGMLLKAPASSDFLLSSVQEREEGRAGGWGRGSAHTRRSRKDSTILATKGPPPSPICSAATPACWEMLHAPEVLWLWIAAAAAANLRGAARYPSLHPVIHEIFRGAGGGGRRGGGDAQFCTDEQLL